MFIITAERHFASQVALACGAKILLSFFHPSARRVFKKTFSIYSEENEELRCSALNKSSYYNSHKQYVNANNTKQESVFMAFLYLIFLN